MEWADASVWRAVFISPEARADQKLRELFYHLHLVQRAFLRAWRGEPPNRPYPTFDEMNDASATSITVGKLMRACGPWAASRQEWTTSFGFGSAGRLPIGTQFNSEDREDHWTGSPCPKSGMAEGDNLSTGSAGAL